MGLVYWEFTLALCKSKEWKPFSGQLSFSTSHSKWSPSCSSIPRYQNNTVTGTKFALHPLPVMSLRVRNAPVVTGFVLFVPTALLPTLGTLVWPLRLTQGPNKRNHRNEHSYQFSNVLKYSDKVINNVFYWHIIAHNFKMPNKWIFALESCYFGLVYKSESVCLPIAKRKTMPSNHF